MGRNAKLRLQRTRRKSWEFDVQHPAGKKELRPIPVKVHEQGNGDLWRFYFPGGRISVPSVSFQLVGSESDAKEFCEIADEVFEQVWRDLGAVYLQLILESYRMVQEDYGDCW